MFADDSYTFIENEGTVSIEVVSTGAVTESFSVRVFGGEAL